MPLDREYALLVSGDELADTSRQCLIDEFGLAPEHIARSPQPDIPKGFSAGAAGGVSALVVRRGDRLSDRQLCAPVVNAALALVVNDLNVSDLEATDATMAANAAASALRACAASWTAAVALWQEHADGSSTSSAAPEARRPAISFRCATLRGGRHACSSKQLDGALGEAVLDLNPGWTVDLSSPAVLVLCVIVQRHLLIGLLLPPYAARKSAVLPSEPRPWLISGYEAGEDHRPHMRPSRAAALVRLLFAPRPAPCAPLVAAGSVLLDPCGGIGILALEAARFAPLLAITLDVDPSAAVAARRNASSAALTAGRREGGLTSSELQGSVLTLVGDAAGGSMSGAGSSSGLRAGTIDAAVADLPFGMLYARMDVGKLLVELARLIRVGGRALIVGSAGPSGTARACVKSARRYTPGKWRVEAEVASAAGGVALTAVLLERVTVTPQEPKAPEATAAVPRVRDPESAPAESQRSPPPAPDAAVLQEDDRQNDPCELR